MIIRSYRMLEISRVDIALIFYYIKTFHNLSVTISYKASDKLSYSISSAAIVQKSLLNH